MKEKLEQIKAEAVAQIRAADVTGEDSMTSVLSSSEERANSLQCSRE